MPGRLISWCLCLTILTAAFALPALADGKRVALVIGNSKYRHSAELRNPHNDAKDVAAELQQLGFTVISGYDLENLEMRRTIGRFAEALETATVGVFYYAGHGMQLNGTNYLVPTDSKLENQYSPEFELIPFGMVQRVMENKKRTNILFLDACRDNPLARNLARAMGTRSTSIQSGLSPTESGIGTLISYSTQPGNVALDGTGRNSPYADALVKQLRQPTLPISDMLLNVRREVRQATQDRQITWEHSALSERFYFAPPKPVVVAPPPPPAAKLDEDRDPAELTPVQKSRLSARLNRELRRVGCDPRATGGTWTATSQTALQRFAEIMKLALHTDEPTKAALDAVASHKFIVCPAAIKVPPMPDKPVQAPIAVVPPPAIVTPPTTTAVVVTPPPTIASPPAVIAPAAVTPPAPAVPSATVTPPAAAKPPKAEPRPLPRAAAVKSPPPPQRSPAAAAPPAPFATSIQRENKCRIETEAECRARLGMLNPTASTYHSVCAPISTRKEICPGSRPAEARPPPARTVERKKQCRIETHDECRRRQGLVGPSDNNSYYACGPVATRKEICR